MPKPLRLLLPRVPTWLAVAAALLNSRLSLPPAPSRSSRPRISATEALPVAEPMLKLSLAPWPTTDTVLPAVVESTLKLLPALPSRICNCSRAA